MVLALNPLTRSEEQGRSVPHSEIKAKLDAEKKVRSRKRTQKSKIAAFRAANKTD